MNNKDERDEINEKETRCRRRKKTKRLNEERASEATDIHL